MHGQMSTQAAADGSSYLEMGNTKVICTVEGPAELRQRGAPNQAADDKAIVSVELNIAGFSATDRKKQSRGDKYDF